MCSRVKEWRKHVDINYGSKQILRRNKNESEAIGCAGWMGDVGIHEQCTNCGSVLT